MSKKDGFFFTGLLAAGLGALAGLLMAPKSGKETREDVIRVVDTIAKDLRHTTKESEKRVIAIFGKSTKKARLLYKTVRREVFSRVADLKKTGKELDKEKYFKIVDNVANDLKSDITTTKGSVVKLSEYLKKDWEKVKNAVMATETTSKKA